MSAVPDPRRMWWVAGLSAAGFAGLGAFVLAGATAPADQEIHDRLRAFALDNPAWLAWMGRLTHLGDTLTVGLAALVIVIVCLARRRPTTAGFVAVAAVLAWALSRALRAWLARPRPADRLWVVDSASFPSGHATNSASLAIILVVVSWAGVGWLGRACLLTAAVVYAGTVGLTRVAGGVHWPTDVLGAWLLALAVISGIAAVARTPHSERPRPTERARQRYGSD